MAHKTHEVTDHPEHGALMPVLIEHGRRFHCVEALIDNGSARSLLPYSAVAKLGLERTLRRGYGIRVAGGGRVRAWRTKAQLKAQIATYIEGDYDHIGPLVTLDPWFVKSPRLRRGSGAPAPRPLLGRTDFLTHFSYSNADGVFRLEWEE